MRNLWLILMKRMQILYGLSATCQMYILVVKATLTEYNLCPTGLYLRKKNMQSKKWNISAPEQFGFFDLVLSYNLRL